LKAKLFQTNDTQIEPGRL